MDNFDKFKEFIKSKTERDLAEIVQKYDFIAGSIELKNALAKVLPEDAKIVFSPYIEAPNLVYAVKKFDILDIFKAENDGFYDKNDLKNRPNEWYKVPISAWNGVKESDKDEDY